ncbi:DUF6460 domain-containing protein [Hyphococcus flavus]|uniref:DUF6460 domain-containing protein n=1 Tax=Hyphococcus flavus TaxID=1866326 RepID=A0AAE9ZCU1_9PROT|nr:DUF6460 domain-containing protein [Hyphococcus flavus]WDI32514.1 DUF6460 domain-containing protein [Hyphococcus flavus]
MSGNDLKSKFTGGNAGKTILQLMIASIVVGAFFSLIGIGPREFWRGVLRNVQNIASSLGENVGEIILTLGTYLLIGAAIVVPIWLVARLLSSRK